MRCQVCNKNNATVHVTELQDADQHAAHKYDVHQQHVCESCAQMMNLPHLPVVKKKSMVDIWKLLQQSAQNSRREGGLTCKTCGMTLAEFRSKGRLGCADCYEAFRRHLDPLLERIHNSSHHIGRLPHADPASRERSDKIRDLRERLESAIREEDYEDAASLRDQLQSLEADDS